MSRRQCSVWGCSNRKERCPEDVEGRRHCKARKLRGKDCPESSAMLSLHSVGKMPQKSTRSSCRRWTRLAWTSVKLSGSLDQKPTSVFSTTTDLKDPLSRILPSYLPYSNDITTSILSQLRSRVDFWIVFRTILMIVNHLHRIHLSLHSSNWERSAWNTRMKLKGLKSM